MASHDCKCPSPATSPTLRASLGNRAPGGSHFLEEVPKALQGWLFLPALLILGLLFYWLGHVGYGAFQRRARSQVLAAPPP